VEYAMRAQFKVSGKKMIVRCEVRLIIMVYSTHYGLLS